MARWLGRALCAVSSKKAARKRRARRRLPIFGATKPVVDEWFLLVWCATHETTPEEQVRSLGRR